MAAFLNRRSWNVLGYGHRTIAPRKTASESGARGRRVGKPMPLISTFSRQLNISRQWGDRFPGFTRNDSVQPA